MRFIRSFHPKFVATAQATITVSDPHPLKGDRAHGVVSAVLDTPHAHRRAQGGNH